MAIYALTAMIFLAFALGVDSLLGTSTVVGLFAVLCVLYAWVAYVMIKQKSVLELHAYITCSACGELTPTRYALYELWCRIN